MKTFTQIFKAKWLLAFIVMLFAGINLATAAGDVYTWVGGHSGNPYDFNEKFNWQEAGYGIGHDAPDVSYHNLDMVIIPNTSYQPIMASDKAILWLTIKSGATLTLASGAHLQTGGGTATTSNKDTIAGTLDLNSCPFTAWSPVSGTGTISATTSPIIAFRDFNISNFIAGTSTITFLGTIVQSINAGTYNNFVINSGGTAVRPLGDITLTGNVSTSTSSSGPSLDCPNGSITTYGDITGINLSSKPNIIFQGGKTQYVDGYSFDNVTVQWANTNLVTNGQLTIKHQLLVKNHATLSLGASLAPKGTALAGSTWVFESGATFETHYIDGYLQVKLAANFTKTIPATGLSLILDGTGGQNTGVGTSGTGITSLKKLVCNDPLGVSLDDNLTITDTLTITDATAFYGSSVPFTLTYGSGAVLYYNGTVQGSSTDELFDVTSGVKMENVCLNNSGGLIVNVNPTIYGTLTMTSGALDITTFGVTIAFDPLSGPCILKYNGTAGQITTDAEFPSTGGPTTLEIANLNAAGVTLHDTRTITGNLQVDAGGYFYSFPSGIFTIGGDATVDAGSGSGGDIFLNGGEIDLTGSLTGTGRINYGNNSDHIKVGGDWTVASGTATNTGTAGTITSIVEFTGSGAHALHHMTFNNLIVTGTVTGDGGFEIDQDFTGSGTFAAASGSVMTFAGTNMTIGSYTANGSRFDLRGTNFATATPKTQYLNNPYTFYNLRQQNAETDLANGNVTVTNNLEFYTAGAQDNVVCGANKLIMSSGATITSASAANGYLVANSVTGGALEMNVSTGATTFPVGPAASNYTPLVLSYTAGPINTDVSVDNHLTDQTFTAVGNHAVGLTWLAIPASSAVATVNTNWNGANELTSFDRSHAYLSWRNQQTTSPSPWAPLGSSSGAASGGSDPYNITGAAMQNFQAGTNYIATLDNLSPLPVTLTSFHAKYVTDHVNLDWHTASEINNSHFNIERSTNGMEWTTIGRVEGHGNSMVMQNYNAIDNLAGVPPVNTLYYRLKQVDFNGMYTYSDIRSVSLQNTIMSLEAYPNPAKDNMTISWNNSGNSTVKIVNMNGVTVYTENMSGEGALSKNINISALAPGVYTLQVISANNMISKTIYKN